MNKKNILTIITSSYGGGAERLVFNQMRMFNSKKFNLHVISFRSGQLENDFNSFNNVKYSCMNQKKHFSYNTLFRINAYVKKNRIDVIHCHLIEAELYGMFLKILNPKLKFVITKHNANDFRKKLLYRLLGKLISLFSNKIICVSNEIFNFTKKYEFVNVKKLVTLSNGIIVKDKSKATRDNLGYSKDDFLVGVVGRLTEQKGHIYLIKALELIKDDISSMKVLFLGDGKLEDSLRKEVKERDLTDIVEFCGFKSNMDDYYSNLDVLCMPSLWEGLSLVLLEGMSFENVVVMSDLPNNLEVAKPDVEGIYFKKCDVKDLSEKLLYVYNNWDEVKSVGKNARTKVISDFNFKDNLKKIESLY